MQEVGIEKDDNHFEDLKRSIIRGCIIELQFAYVTLFMPLPV